MASSSSGEKKKSMKKKRSVVGGGGVEVAKGAERSAYFARREAAKVLNKILKGHAEKKAAGSIKSLVYSPTVRNKKATYALVCQTLKYLWVIKDALEESKIMNGRLKRQQELVYIVAYDILFGHAVASFGVLEKHVLAKKKSLELSLARICLRKNVKNIHDLFSTNDHYKPRYVRVNTLKMDVHAALNEFQKTHEVTKDDLVPDLLVFPSGTDLHDHPLVMNGGVFLQGKASSMPAVALRPQPGWEVLDACSAPGNKTVQVAALMEGRGRIIACELHKERVRVLEDTIKRAGASNIEVLHGDFLKIDKSDTIFSKVRAILLDPSCSGSGTAHDRMDYLLPSHEQSRSGHTGKSEHDMERERARKLAVFQKKALAHALSFPAVERVVYSTCSIYQEENEDVVSSVLPFAETLNFQLETVFPEWHRRGLPVFNGAEDVLRTDPSDGMEGFFIALFVKNLSPNTVDPDSRRLQVSAESNSKHCTSKHVSLTIKGRASRCSRSRGKPVRNGVLTWPFRKLCRQFFFSIRKRNSRRHQPSGLHKN